jgi:hypothetical protein
MPGSIGNDNYSPVVYVANQGEFYNAPVVASPDATEDDLNVYCDGLPEDEAGLAQAREILHDRVVAICPREQTITLKLVPGHSFARPILYISTDANDPTAAAMEQATFAPALALVPVGGDDSFGSAVERLFAVTNGPSNFDLPDSASVSNHPLRNGFYSALRGEGSPLNVLGGIPT